MTLLIMDSNTGEVIEEGYKIISQKKSDAFRKRLDIINNPFIWVNLEYIDSLQLRILIKGDSDLNLTVLGACLYLATYINAEDNLICRKGKNKTAYSRHEIKELLQMKDRSFYKFLKVTKELGLLYEKNERFYFNKKFHYVGKNSHSNTYARIYVNGVRSFIRSGNKFDSLGFLYLIIPYLSYEDCSLVHDYTGEQYLEKSDLIAYLGISRPTLNKYLKTEFKILKNNRLGSESYKLFGVIKLKKRGIIKVNPLIIRREAVAKGGIKPYQIEQIFK